MDDRNYVEEGVCLLGPTVSTSICGVSAVTMADWRRKGRITLAIPAIRFARALAEIGRQDITLEKLVGFWALPGSGSPTRRRATRRPVVEQVPVSASANVAGEGAQASATLRRRRRSSRTSPASSRSSDGHRGRRLILTGTRRA